MLIYAILLSETIIVTQVCLASFRDGDSGNEIASFIYDTVEVSAIVSYVTWFESFRELLSQCCILECCLVYLPGMWRIISCIGMLPSSQDFL